MSNKIKNISLGINLFNFFYLKTDTFKFSFAELKRWQLQQGGSSFFTNKQNYFLISRVFLSLLIKLFDQLK
jgi:hypothetical protein